MDELKKLSFWPTRNMDKDMNIDDFVKDMDRYETDVWPYSEINRIIRKGMLSKDMLLGSPGAKRRRKKNTFFEPEKDEKIDILIEKRVRGIIIFPTQPGVMYMFPGCDIMGSNIYVGKDYGELGDPLFLVMEKKSKNKYFYELSFKGGVKSFYQTPDWAQDNPAKQEKMILDYRLGVIPSNNYVAKVLPGDIERISESAYEHESVERGFYREYANEISQFHKPKIIFQHSDVNTFPPYNSDIIIIPRYTVNGDKLSKYYLVSETVNIIAVVDEPFNPLVERRKKDISNAEHISYTFANREYIHSYMQDSERKGMFNDSLLWGNWLSEFKFNSFYKKGFAAAVDTVDSLINHNLTQDEWDANATSFKRIA